MKKLKNRSFTTTLDLEQGREYQFHYLMDDVNWENGPHADKYVSSPYGESRNCVIIIRRQVE